MLVDIFLLRVVDANECFDRSRSHTEHAFKTVAADLAFALGKAQASSEKWSAGLPLPRKGAKRIAQFYSVQPELTLNEAELLWGDQPPMGDTNPIERPIKIGGPEIQEIDEFRKVRREVVVLPDIALQ